jgi:peptide/nickel transport system permease protein
VVTTATGRVGLICAGVVLATIAVGSLCRAAPNTVAVNHEYLSPSWSHPLGTDAFGRDELARLAAGGRTSLSAAIVIIVVAMGIALIVGITSGLLGGTVDVVFMRIDDVVLSIPTLVFAMGVVAALGPGLGNLTIALSISYAAQFTRMARAFALASRTRADLTAARLAGIGWIRVVVGHVLPDVSSQLFVVSTLSFGGVIVSLASLSFLGLGAQIPTAEWGSMLSGAQVTFTSAPWLILAPGLAIVMSTMAVNLIADSLREHDDRPGRGRVPGHELPEEPVAGDSNELDEITIRDLRVIYADGTVALRGVALSVAPRTITAVIGESGSGKSTVALAALGMLPANARVAGSIRIGGQQIVGAAEQTVRAQRGTAIGYVAQDPQRSFDPLRSVGSTVEEAWLVHHLHPADATIVDALEQLGIDEAATRRRRRPHEWSGGMLQRASIVAANAHRPPVIVADEPTSALDTDRADDVLAAFPSTGAAVLFISHDLDLARRHSDHVAVLYAGRIVEDGPTERVLGHPRHPYTAALLAASPRPGAGLPTPLPGSVPRLVGDPPGCSFAPRCPFADRVCHDRQPSLQHGVACWHPRGPLDG